MTRMFAEPGAVLYGRDLTMAADPHGRVWGTVVLQQYGPASFRVAAFIPGEPKPHDTGIEPELTEWSGHAMAAVAHFHTVLENLRYDGWQVLP